MSLSEIIVNLIKEMQLNETELEEIKQAITEIQQKQPRETYDPDVNKCYASVKKEVAP